MVCEFVHGAGCGAPEWQGPPWNETGRAPVAVHKPVYAVLSSDRGNRVHMRVSAGVPFESHPLRQEKCNKYRWLECFLGIQLTISHSLLSGQFDRTNGIRTAWVSALPGDECSTMSLVEDSGRGSLGSRVSDARNLLAARPATALP